MPAEIGTQAASAVCECDDFSPECSLRKPAQAHEGRLALSCDSCPSKRGVVCYQSLTRRNKIAEAYRYIVRTPEEPFRLRRRSPAIQ